MPSFSYLIDQSSSGGDYFSFLRINIFKVFLSYKSNFILFHQFIKKFPVSFRGKLFNIIIILFPE